MVFYFCFLTTLLLTATSRAELIHPLVNGNMELTEAWAANPWGNPNYQWSYDTVEKQSGLRSLKFKVNSFGTGLVHIYQNISLQYGHRYRLKAYVKSDSQARVRLHVRQENYNNPLNTQATVGTTWTLLQAEGVFSAMSDAASVRFELQDLGPTIWVDSITLEDLGDAQLISNGDMETASGWDDNSWGTPAPVYSWSYDNSTGNAHRGTRALKFRVTSVGDGDVHIMQRYNFKMGHKYKYIGWVKSNVNTTVSVTLRDDTTYENFASSKVYTTSEWKRFEVDGVYTGVAERGSIRLAHLNKNVDVWLDDVLVVDLGDVQMLSTGDFDSGKGSWFMRSWPAGAAIYQLVHDTNTANSQNASAGSLRYNFLQQLTPDVDLHVQILHRVNLERETLYEFATSLKASQPTDVEITVREETSPNRLMMSKTVRVGTGWQRVALRSTFVGLNKLNAVRIEAKTLNTQLWVDNAVFVPLRRSQLLLNGDIEGNIGYQPQSKIWWLNKWAGASGEIAVETNPLHVLNGQQSLRFKPISRGDGDIELTHDYPFETNKNYRLSLWIKADGYTDGKIFMRRSNPHFDHFASRFLKITPNWQLVTIEGTFRYTDTGSVRVNVQNLGRTVWVDEVVLEEIPTVEWKVKDPSKVISPHFFGLHVNHVHHDTWPPIGQEVIRLWDTGTTWNKLEPEQDKWIFDDPNPAVVASNRFDIYLNYIRRHNQAHGSSVVALYTFGMNPAWAAINPSDACGTGPYGVAACSGPRNLEDWRDYVRRLGERNKVKHNGLVKYWEIWNEVNVNYMYRGSMQLLVDMTRIAHEELKSIDSGNVIISPNFTPIGVSHLSEFLALGGAQYVDIMSFHWYINARPEDMRFSITNIMNVLRDYKVTKPVWNTEGAPTCNSAVENCTINIPTRDEIWGVLPRGMLLMAAAGIEMFGYYNWEREEGGYAMIIEDANQKPIANLDLSWAYRNTKEWMVGARILDVTETIDGIVRMTIFKNGVKNYIVWTTKTSATFYIPSSWNVHTATFLEGIQTGIAPGGTLRLTGQPQILRP